jgi:hypothetical protein
MEWLDILDRDTQKPVEKLPIDRDFVPASPNRHLPLLPDNGPNCVEADVKPADHLVYAHALLMHQKQRFALVPFDHGASS